MFGQILVVGVVSFFTDVSSEAIFAVLPLFVTSVLGASAQTLGAMEGFADFAASSLDMVSGRLSDRSGRRKVFALLGYSLSSLAKVSASLRRRESAPEPEMSSRPTSLEDLAFGDS